MFGMKPDPKKMEKMMKRLNINTREVAATEVVIKTAGKDIVIENPEVMIMNVMGREVYQISGQLRATREEDVKMVMEQTGEDRTTVEKKLEELNNDLAKAIMELKKK